MSSACGAEAGLITVDQALDLLKNTVVPLATEVKSLKDALGYFLAADIFSEINLPLFSQSAVDGYALCSSETIFANTIFDLIGEVRAGEVSNIHLIQGQAVRIFTGAKIPEGTTTVARQEIVDVLDKKRIKTSSVLNRHADIRDVGEEITTGQCLASKGQQLTVGAIAALSMAGVKHVTVNVYPRVAVVITGDEVVTNSRTLNEGQIFDANTPLIQAWFKAKGHQVDVIHIEDQYDLIVAEINHLKQRYDVVITTGGVSVGDYDFIRPAVLENQFQQIFWKVKQKPGKPMLFACYQCSDLTQCYVLGLPGNPAAVYVAMQIYVNTLLNALQGHDHIEHEFSAILEQPLKIDARERFLRMSASYQDGVLIVKNLVKQQSHMLSNLMNANCLVRIPAEVESKAGDVVHGFFISY